MLVPQRDETCSSSAQGEKMASGSPGEPVTLGLVYNYVKTEAFQAQKSSSQIDYLW